MNSQSWGDIVARRARVRGCLLGGAIGDALGYPIEFQPLASIRNGYGPSGVTGFLPVGGVVLGQVSDDTQMTLFTAEGLIRAYARYGPATDNGISSAGPVLVRNAYLRWLDTQNHPAPPPPAELAHHRTGWLRQQTWLYARRAPGNACVSGLRYEHIPDTLGELGAPGPVNPDSKGCGTVMRSAPFGLTGMPVRRAFEFAARCAQITHGHPTGYYAAGAFAAMIRHLLDGDSLEGAVLRSMELLARYPGHEETTAALRKAVDLAADGTATPEKVETLGGGWIAEEALAIAVYCALARPADPAPRRTRVESAFLLSVNHSGDSDSTGSICGNLLGAHHGDLALPPSWLTAVEGRGTITELADDFSAAFHPLTHQPYNESFFAPGRYPRS
ncbi:ADP-ribosylglycohydrolase family protein [Streptomyces caniferus]|uniref:ADP-ribosylglycohydrolase family protein n=1 Tax=Streptomyces caniferus TaxID=285557 RepID=UPI002E2C0BDA|nr:ADP-ribosylglycohydrolase family protein [Streptomyces caniferus]